MYNARTPEEKIRKLKDQIADCRDYIVSDFCTNCVEMHKKIKEYEEQIKEIEKTLE